MSTKLKTTEYQSFLVTLRIVQSGEPLLCQQLVLSSTHMCGGRYNFLYVLCAGGAPEPASMGSHTPEGYAQRARFYGISDEV